MKIELIAYFLSGTVLSTLIGKLWDYFNKEREAVLRKKELYFSHKIKAAETAIASYTNVFSNLEGLRLCYLNFGESFLQGKPTSCDFLMAAVSSFSQKFELINASTSLEIFKISLYVDATDKEFKKIEEITLPFIGGMEELMHFYQLFQREVPSDAKELEKILHELFTCLKSFISTCDMVEKYLISEIQKLRKIFVKYD